jgi:hypothetical protein
MNLTRYGCLCSELAGRYTTNVKICCGSAAHWIWRVCCIIGSISFMEEYRIMSGPSRSKLNS